MINKNDEFLKRLLAMFRVEADEHLAAMSAGLIELEKAPVSGRRAEIVEKIFREAHSLKGAARAVKLGEIESVCHALESVFAELKGNRIAASAALFDLLHQALDALGGLLASDAQTGIEAQKPMIAALIRQLELALKGLPPAQVKPSLTAPPHETPFVPDKPAATTSVSEPLPVTSLGLGSGLGSGTVRVDTIKLGSVMRQTEELLAPRLALGRRVRELRETGTILAGWKRERDKIQPGLRLMERLLKHSGKGASKGQRGSAKVLEHLEAENVFLKKLGDRLARLERSAASDHRTMSAMVDNLLHDVKEMHMLPFSSLLEMFPRLARELARDQGKQLELLIQGDKIEIDRRILEEMKDPFIHLLRNCIDHGLEKPPAREQKGKTAQGTITVAITQQDSGKIEILFADDGAGIDVGKVKAAAARMGIISADELDKLDEREALALIFRSGVSTSPMVTDLSGRGLGLAIVREKVEHLGGAIALDTHPDAGTTIRIVLPLTFATFRGVLVRTGGQLFIIPVTGVERVARVAGKDILTVENRETIPLDGQAVSLVQLGNVLGMPQKNAAAEAAAHAQVVVMGVEPVRVAFRVDEILGEREVLVKALGRQLVRVRNIAGATVLGGGRVVPVLNVPDLMKSAVKLTASPLMPAAGEPAEAQKRSILVVEDSIISRTLIKNILESAGYTVATAVDGLDAYTLLKTAAFDLVVSDVEMPRMNGLDLTAKIRSDKQLSELPVVLVTALDSREHRERGIDVGANAYIVKGSFDQSNLLGVIRQLI